MRLHGKVAIVVGAGQTPGETIGNGRATAITFAREGAKVMLVDRDLDSAVETERIITGEGSVETHAFAADVTKEADCAALARACVEQFGRIDVLHNNVGIGGEDGSVLKLAEEAWDRIVDTNLKSMFLTCKHVLPTMRSQRSGAIVNISSVASIASVPMLAYKVSKAGVNALTQQVAAGNAKYGIRCNAILPGLMNTPMAIDAWVRSTGISRDEMVQMRDKQVPLGGRQGEAWDVANAALFLASDEAKFITGVLLPVDGGQSIKIG
jgi:NAD(P)-dependent dehydrogenase (short-subunit alcohol dehydrogenase family)